MPVRRVDYEGSKREAILESYVAYVRGCPKLYEGPWNQIGLRPFKTLREKLCVTPIKDNIFSMKSLSMT